MTADKCRNHRVSLCLALMVLSDADSNNYNAILQFKESISTPLSESTDSPNQIVSPNDRKINGYGEIEARYLREKHKRLSKDEIQSLIAGYQSGKTVYELAKEFGCHRVTVSESLKKNGVNVTICKYGRLDVPDIIAMYEARHTSAEIARKYNVAANLIIRCLRDNGIKIRGRWDY